MKACRPRMIGPRSAMYRQSSRIESAAAWSWTVQVSDPTGRSRCRTPSDTGRTGGPHRCANAQRGIEGGVPVAPAVGRESRAHSGTATRERQSGRGSWSSLTWCREPKPPRVMRWLTTQVSGQCPLPRTIPDVHPRPGASASSPSQSLIATVMASSTEAATGRIANSSAEF
jgi:hypothetical protein